MNKLILTTLLALAAAQTFAMPTKTELKKAQPLVVELMAPAMEKYKSAPYKEKAAAAAKVGDASAEFAKAAETEAAKFLLLKGAVSFYARGEQYDKAAETVTTLQREIKDVPPAVIAEITGKATGRISETKAPALYALYRTAKLQVRASEEAKALAAKLKKAQSDALQRKYAEALAVSGDWKSAYTEFAKVKNAKLQAIVKDESSGSAKNADAGEFWWTYEPAMEDAEDFFKSHAAAFYRKALDAGEITGLKKNIIEQRIKGVKVDVAAEVGSSVGVGGSGGLKSRSKGNGLRKLEYKGSLPKRDTLLWKDVSLSSINTIKGYSGGAAGRHFTSSSHMKGNGIRRTVQFQVIHDSYLKCIGVELTQQDADVYGRVIYARYVENGSLNETDFDTDTCKSYYVAGDAKEHGYSIQDLCIVFDEKDTPSPAAVSTSAATPTSSKAWQEKGNTAWLTLDNGAKIEFAKCPAGEFKQVVSREQKKIKVRISRDFWIMKTPLTCKQASAIPGIPHGNGSDEIIVGINRNHADRVAEFLTDAFAQDLPKKMVLRLPTAAEWEYAFRANTRNRKSPFYEMIPGHGDRKQAFGLDKNKLSIPNDWGISYPNLPERLLDTYSSESLVGCKWDRAKDPKGVVIGELPKYTSTEDPFSWSEEEDRVAMITKGSAWMPWSFYVDPSSCWGPVDRFVVGPDLVSEWRAKHGKK